MATRRLVDPGLAIAPRGHPDLAPVEAAAWSIVTAPSGQDFSHFRPRNCPDLTTPCNRSHF